MVIGHACGEMHVNLILCVESYIDNVKEEFDRVSLTVREEEDWVVSAGNREEGAKI